MSVDISALGQVTPSQPLSLADYPSSVLPTKTEEKKPFSLAPAGEYVLRAPDAFTFSVAQKSGNLMARIDPVVVGPTNEGTSVKYSRVSTTQFERDGKLASLAGDYVRAVAVANGLPVTEFPGVAEDGNAQAQADAIASTAGKTYRARLNWEAEDRKHGSGIKIKGMSRFPRNEDGTYQPWIELKDRFDEQGRPVRIWANLYIQSFVTE